MPDEVAAPILPYEELQRRAEAFLSQHHRSGSIPVPIEEIVEFQLGMDIVPIPGLHQSHEIDGFTTSDLREIHVDEFVYAERPGRYRFTLAHEVGHVVLHRALYLPRRFTSLPEWKAFVNSIPEREHGWLEYQAYAFAGLILVPPAALVRESRDCVQRTRDEGIDLSANWDYAWSRIAAFLAKRFEVSSQVIEKRLNKEAIPESFKSA